MWNGPLLLLAAGTLALPAGGSYVTSGNTYGFDLSNSGPTAWRSFAIVAPAGVAFVGGTTGNEGSATCTVGPPTQIVCGPLGPAVVPSQGRISFVATMSAPAVCGVTFQLFVSTADGVPPAYVSDVTAAPACAQPAAPSVATRPTVHGTPAAGRTLRATPPSWSARPSSVRYRWQRCTPKACTAIADGLVLRLTKQDVGKTVRLVATATVAGHTVRTSSRLVRVRQ